VHFDNLLFLLLVAVALLFRWLASKAGQTSKDSEESERRSTSTPRTPPPIPHAPAETDEERIRKFLEALGQPTTSKPPPPIVPRIQEPARLPHLPPPIPPLFTESSRRPRKVKLPGEFTKSPYEAKKFTPKVAEAARFEIQEGPAPADPPPVIKTAAEAYAAVTQPAAQLEQRKTNIEGLLRSTSGLRDAIILREIFGPPRSLQPLDAIGSA
jgi:hypothetical protein